MNIAFIDGQNLHINTSKVGERWEIDLVRFREYLKSKYSVSIAYYYIGTKRPKSQDLYETIRKAGYIVKFRQHGYKFTGKKKGNVDSDIIFDIMKLSKQEIVNSKIVLVSGDGDYKMVVDYLIEIGKMEKILFPNKKRASSLYRKIPVQLKVGLDEPDIMRKIEKLNEKASLGI